ncbi:hypothetical protein AOQ84DRAFT_351276 [Glonium stellatum]|uniref:Inositol-pentakisphosphate 2-kinase n=1 Tax=Glonium stellatum TaxID=574774 RepID=A0A8E2FEQ1_9PEZI|nr:hypothetical protein AOQ84DRAFT_351276 [Glonium stellatum]
MINCYLAREEHAARFQIYTLQYLAEGAANIVLTIQPLLIPLTTWDNTFAVYFADEDARPLPPIEGKVLRLGKDVPNAPTCKIISKNFEDNIKPMFDEKHIVSHELVYMDASVIKVLNSHLDEMDSSGRRPEARVGTRVEDQECNGLLITDMSSVPGISATMEIKPKWLLQSPNAPPNAERCRTCAIRAQRESKERAQGKLQNHTTRPFCPLALISGDRKTVLSIVSGRLYQGQSFKELAVQVQVQVINRVADYLTTGPGFMLLQQLERAQKRFDPVGILSHQCFDNYDGEDEHCSGAEMIKLAMTLRDCSMFIRVHYDGRIPAVEARLADLDPKSEGKMKDWKWKEMALNNGGWYMGKESDRVPETLCVVAQERNKELPWYF